MITLCLDTCYKYLTCVLIKDDSIIASYSQECFKRQSEELFPVLDNLFNNSGINKTDIDSLCITSGPGSYTGVRIAMALAKTLCDIREIDLYTISTLCLYAANNPKTMVILDARANRSYVGVYDRGNVVVPDSIMFNDEIDSKDYTIVGDGELIGKDNVMNDIPKAFLKTRNSWTKVDNISHLVPQYLKESESYYR